MEQYIHQTICLLFIDERLLLCQIMTQTFHLNRLNNQLICHIEYKPITTINQIQHILELFNNMLQ